MKIKLTLLALIAAAPCYGTVVVQDNFDYADGDVDLYNGGTGWAAAWENGNSNATRRFIVSSNTALYQGGGSGTTTRQNRDFSSAISVGLNDTITLEFTLLRNETQSGRGIGIDLTNGGASQYFIGKKINGNVGLHDAVNGASHTTFGSNTTSETISATLTYDGANTSIVLADSNETLSSYSHTGSFTFDGISLTGYNGATVNNGIDDISINVDTVPEPSSSALLGLGGLALILRRRK